MLGMVGSVLGGFLLVVRLSYRSERQKRVAGEAFAPEGKIRWGSRPEQRAE